MMGYDDAGAGTDDDAILAATEVLGYSMAMAEERRACPRDDIVTKLISAEIDGHGLSDDEFGFFVLMLAVAGNETTRNAMSLGMLAFLDHPDQWELFKAERPDTAADEIVRWATPITAFQRTAVADTVLGGRPECLGRGVVGPARCLRRRRGLRRDAARQRRRGRDLREPVGARPGRRLAAGRRSADRRRRAGRGRYRRRP
jgi:cytochrome P450